MSMTKDEIIKELEKTVAGAEILISLGHEEVNEYFDIFKAALSALRPITREQVEKMRGEWIDIDGEKVPVDEYGQPFGWAKCSACEEYLTASNEYPCIGHFCPNCGAPMTDEAVEMVMERLEALKDEKG